MYPAFHKPCLKACAAFLFAAFAFPAYAKGIAAYQEKVRKAREDIYSLIAFSEEADAESRNGEKEILERLRSQFSKGERIEWDGRSIEVKHDWLLSGLEEFTSAEDAYEKGELGARLNARLDSIGAKLNELRNARSGERSKDEDKQKLGEILSRPDFLKPQKKEQEENPFMKWLKETAEAFFKWIDGFMPKINPGLPAGEALQPLSILIQVVVVVLALGTIGFLVYKISPYLIKGIRSREKKERGARVILGEKVMADQDAGDLFSEAERFASEGDIRSAIRKGYIALLCELSDRKMIGLAQHKTNRDYLRDLKGRKELHANMHSMTSSFEQAWYGFGEAGHADWEEFKGRYQRSINSN